LNARGKGALHELFHVVVGAPPKEPEEDGLAQGDELVTGRTIAGAPALQQDVLRVDRVYASV
jgi:hypothetical protein